MINPNLPVECDRNRAENAFIARLWRVLVPTAFLAVAATYYTFLRINTMEYPQGRIFLLMRPCLGGLALAMAATWAFAREARLFYRDIPRPGRMWDFLAYPSYVHPLLWRPRSSPRARMWLALAPAILFPYPAGVFLGEYQWLGYFGMVTGVAAGMAIGVGLVLLQLRLLSSREPWVERPVKEVMRDLIDCEVRGIYLGTYGPMKMPLVIDEQILKGGGACASGPPETNKTTFLMQIGECLSWLYQQGR